MKTHGRHIPSARSIAFAVVLLAAMDSAAGADVAVIAHPSVSTSELSRADVINLFTGDIRLWENGDLVVVFDLKQKNPTREAFYDFIGKSASRVKSIWMKRMLSGEGDPPESLSDETDVVARVASTPGAIGFVDSKLVDDRVKRLLVITAPQVAQE